MRCEVFDATLDALLAGRCTAGAWAAAEAHLAECPRCRRLFDAVSGRADDLSADGHDSLAARVVARTSGSGRSCASARERLCDFVDGGLGAFDRELIEGHLAHCAECSALADAVAEQTRLLATFANLPPRQGIRADVLAATSRRQIEPTLADRIGAWLSRAAQRPRFSLEVAYVMTVLLLVVLGNPVDAFKEASVRVAPTVTSGAEALLRKADRNGLANDVGTLLEESGLAALVSRAQAAVGSAVGAAEIGLRPSLLARGIQWLESVAAHIGEWAGRVIDAVRKTFTAPSEPPAREMR